VAGRFGRTAIYEVWLMARAPIPRRSLEYPHIVVLTALRRSGRMAGRLA